MCLRVPRPEVLKRFGAFRCLHCRDAVAPEDVESTLLVLELFQDGVQAGFENTPLKNLRSKGIENRSPDVRVPMNSLRILARIEQRWSKNSKGLKRRRLRFLALTPKCLLNGFP